MWARAKCHALAYLGTAPLTASSEISSAASPDAEGGTILVRQTTAPRPAPTPLFVGPWGPPLRNMCPRHEPGQP